MNGTARLQQFFPCRVVQLLLLREEKEETESVEGSVCLFYTLTVNQHLVTGRCCTFNSVFH